MMSRHGKEGMALARHGVAAWLLPLLAVVLLVLAGCAAPGRIAGDAGQAFERTGRFSLTAESPGRQSEAVQGGFAWRDDGRSLRFDLSNPMGSVLARVRVEPGAAILERSNGEREYAEDPDALAASVLGEAIPVSGLRYWLQGRAGTGEGASQPESLREKGWEIQLSRYDELGPRLLRLSRQDGGRRVQMRIVIDSQ
ncbi:outer membrane lipoprotein LolB [Paracandidimonas soli]|uniref:Outer-membrane lipoprotein LolB n=2 Tax=Paracandidimonas soli TaxID=1917182 RepID=A0A4R3V445_9BURK|nr:outer membrane lipoprotein LolB [Paracandidimonas soli]